MNLYKFSLPSRHKLSWTCSALLCSTTVASVITLESRTQTISTLLKVTGSTVSNFFTGSSSASEKQEKGENFSSKINSSILSFLNNAGESAKNYSEKTWELFKNLAHWFKDLFNASSIKESTKLSILWQGIKTFFKELWDASDILTHDWLKDLHIKLWKLIIFLSFSETNKSFFDSFAKDRLGKSLDTIKTLLRLPGYQNTHFKISEGLAAFLFLKFIEDPKKAIRKFNRLSDNIDKVLKKWKDKNTVNGVRGEGGEDGSDASSGINGQSSQGASSEVNRKTYILTKENLKEYFEIEEGAREELYELAWLGEINLKTAWGLDIGSKTKKIAFNIVGLVEKIVGAFFGWLTKKQDKSSAS